MKKYGHGFIAYLPSRSLIKHLLMIKMTIMLVCLFSVQTFASKSSAQEKVSLNLKTNTLKKVFKKIERQTKLHFVYNDEMLPTGNNITIEVQNKNWQDALSLALKNTKLDYKLLDGDLVVITNDSSPKEIYQEAIRGKVVDQQNEPLIGVSIQIEGTNIGAVTNAAGEYVIEGVPNTATLVFSYIGFTTQKIVVNNRNKIDVVLQENATGLEEVVVTALGVSRKERSLIYTTQQVDAQQMTEVRDPNNLLNAFQGKVANAYITQSAYGVGGEAKFILRGERSISGNNNALIVVDGVPSILGTSNINPDDIESITILPGASAGALYGSQAGNGVIVVTTKKGQKGKVSVKINSGLTFNSPFALPSLQNIYGQGNNGNLDATVGDSWGAKMTGQEYTNHFGESDTYSANPNNIRDFFSSKVSTNNSISVSGGTDKLQNHLSYTNNSVQGIIPTNDLISHTVSLRTSSQISNRLSTDAKITYFAQDIKNKTRGDEANNTPVMDIYQIPRNVSLANAKQYQIINNIGVAEPTFWPSTAASNYQNPYWVINRDILKGSMDQVSGFLSAKYQLTDWLSVSGRASMEKSFDREEQSTNQGTILFATNPGGYYRESKTISTQKWFDLMFNGSNDITKDLKVDYIAGAIFQDDRYDQVDDIADGLNVTNKFNLNFATSPQLNSIGSEVQTQSVFGQFNLSYQDRLYLDASLRNDWDSRLPAPHSFQYYSIGGAAILSDFISLPNAMSYLKAKINYAEVGNGGQFGLLTSTYSYRQGAGNGYLSRSTVFPIPDLKPEIVKNLEASIEAKFIKNRLGLTLTYYKSNSFNQLLKINMPVATGYQSKYINAGNIENRGLEFVVSGYPVKSEHFNWDVDFNFSFNRNKVINLTDDLNTIYIGSFGNFGAVPQVKVGGSYGDLIADQWQKDASGNYIVTEEGLPLITSQSGEDPGIIGNFNPKEILGLTNTFTYKSFSLRVLVNGRIGGIMVSNTEQNLAFSGITEATALHREGGWNLGGVDLDGKPVSATINAQRFWQTASGKRSGVGEFFAYDATNIRVREISLGYSIPVPKSNSFIESVRISAVARNLFWLYRGSSIIDIPGIGKRKMWFDPDMSKYAPGTEYGAIPSTRSLGLNLQIAF